VDNNQVTEAPDPFQGQTPTLAEFDSWRTSGELPERFKAPETEPPATEKVETADGQEPPKVEQEKPEQERDADGKFKPKEPMFSADQQKAFDRAFAKREAKLRREYDERIAAIESSTKQATPPAKEATQAAAEPTPPELPNLATFQGTAEEYDKLLKEYPKKLEAYLEATRQSKEQQQSLQQKIAASEAKARKDHPDYEELFTGLLDDVKNGEEPPLPDHLLKAISEDTEDPHAIAYHLAKNRDEYRRFVALSPAQALREVLKLEIKLQTPAPAPVVKPAPKAAEKYAPIEPVGARAVSKAFDVTDESLSADEWRKKRDEQIAKRG
jgi:hypothetical protein